MVLKKMKKVIIKKTDKKAMFFTILAIAMLSLFLVSYTFYSIIKDRTAVNKRIETLNNFVFSVEQDLPRQLYVSGYRIIFLLENEIISNGKYIENLSASFEELFLNGTISGSYQPLMKGANFSGIQDSLNQKASKINVDVTLSNPFFIVNQVDPWNVKFTLTTDLLIKDNTNLALWNKTSTVITYIPIENFEDPIYLVETNGLVTNKINKTIYEPFVDGSDVSNLLSHLEDSYYINSTLAPSFLNRLEGIKTPNENGIESLVYLPDLPAQLQKDKSCVDYIYFSGDNPTKDHIQGTPFWFKLDSSHLSVYGVEGLKD